ncbi:hypothetical protein M409DRAFT_56459 [Zasmidium cellare ATCC 36951]|uniref:Uncharacterized protein n=1 Tax=Zasmidium cellare ATCC 36951 TaxID=1080233 RepID=A0A6A6CGU1_ZASCE|nr:uncharacterized protein M409DRAFT_56459 [Zasmidium cellare ATCC 36951]KAF2164636.1 hypothetical protein M409DRAFT_56459 [Zasmidium cellare ATCC 36951]
MAAYGAALPCYAGVVVRTWDEGASGVRRGPDGYSTGGVVLRVEWLQAAHSDKEPHKNKVRTGSWSRTTSILAHGHGTWDARRVIERLVVGARGGTFRFHSTGCPSSIGPQSSRSRGVRANGTAGDSVKQGDFAALMARSLGLAVAAASRTCRSAKVARSGNEAQHQCPAPSSIADGYPESCPVGVGVVTNCPSPD